MPLDAIAGEHIPVLAEKTEPRSRVCWRPTKGAEGWRLLRDGKAMAELPIDQACWTGPLSSGAQWSLQPLPQGRLVKATPSRWRLLDPTENLDPGGQNPKAADLDAAGRLWIGTHECTLARFDPSRDRWAAIPVEPGCGNGGVRGLAVAPDGGVWLHIDALGVARFDPPTETWRLFPSALVGGRDWLGPDDRGGIWFLGAGATLLHEGKATTRLALPALPTGCTLQGATGEPTGELWLGSTCGLFRLRPGEAPVRFGPEAGIDEPVVDLGLSREGQLWLRQRGEPEGRLHTIVGSFDPAVGRFTARGETGAAPLDPVNVTLRLGPDGRAWAADRGRVCVFEGERWACGPGPDPKGIGYLLIDAVGEPWWLGGGSLAHRGSGGWSFVGHPHDPARYTAIPAASISLWGGSPVAWAFEGGRIWRISGTKGITEGWAVASVTGRSLLPEMLEDATGGLWLLKGEQLLRREAGQAFSPSASLEPETSLVSVEGEGAVWLEGPSGLQRRPPSGNPTVLVQTSRLLDPPRNEFDCSLITVPGKGSHCIHWWALGQGGESGRQLLTDQGLVQLDPQGVPTGMEPTPSSGRARVGSAAEGATWIRSQEGAWLRLHKDSTWEPFGPLLPTPKATTLRFAGEQGWWVFSGRGTWLGRPGGPWEQLAIGWLEPIGQDDQGALWAEQHNSPGLLYRFDPATRSWTLPLEALDPILAPAEGDTTRGGAALPAKLLFGSAADAEVWGFLHDVRKVDGRLRAREGVWPVEALP